MCLLVPQAFRRRTGFGREWKQQQNTLASSGLAEDHDLLTLARRLGVFCA
jgi:hypothetical protein